MIANIFICDKSFAFNGVDTLRVFQKKVLGMRSLFSVIEEKKSENRLFIHHKNFTETIISNDGDTIGSIILGTEEDKCLMKVKYTRDVFNILLSVFNYPQNCNYSYDDMMEVLSDDYEDDNNCYGVVAMNHLLEFPKTKQILYDEKGFYRFRRYYIGKLVKDPIEFMEQIESYYDNLILNSDREFFCNELGKVIVSHGECIINGLNVLSEKLKSEICGKGEIKAENISNLLESFAKSNGLDDASFEGKNKKDNLYFEFRKDLDQDCNECITLYCGPHLKMYHDDKGNDNQHLRIYFAWDNANLDVVYIGMISSHVK